ncbi:MAG: CoA transferase [Phycisphaeraceae bacterium]|nr:CoA transferase [Phycisphaeraceae bacterium]
MLPLKGLLVVDLSQFLAGPSASLRLADLGATVIKVERPGSGDLGRHIYIADLKFEDDSLLFHTVNRNKKSLAVDLKNPDDLALLLRLLAKADVMIQNFRPGVIDRLGLGYDAVSQLNRRIVYASISGYGAEGPWRELPGQDLLAQARSGLMWLTGNRNDPPQPCGLSIVDLVAGAHLVQGVLACLIRRGVTGDGAKVEVSLLESILDLQFELLSIYLNDKGELPNRAEHGNANAYLAAPYGVYATQDGFMALAMTPLPTLGGLLGISALADYTSPNDGFVHRDRIMKLIADTLATESTEHWLSILEPANIWCAEVLNWRQLTQHSAFEALHMTQQVKGDSGVSYVTTRCPIRIDGQLLSGSCCAPRVGQHNHIIKQQFDLHPQDTSTREQDHQS